MHAGLLRIAIVPLVLVCLPGRASGQTTWYVDDDNCPGPGAGTQADPFCAIQRAIDESLSADEVIVAPGVYNETIDFIGKAITLRSSDGPDVTTIDATGLDDTVVRCVSGETPDTILQGFTITGGYVSSRSGGGMVVEGSSPTITQCVFSQNVVEPDLVIPTGGAGLYVASGSPNVTDCKGPRQNK